MIVNAVELVTEPRRIAPGEQARSRRTAIGRGDVSLSKSNSVLGERVDVRRGDVLAPVATALAPAEIVRVEDDEVGFLGGGDFLNATTHHGEHHRQRQAE